MATPTDSHPLSGDALLEAVAGAMATAHEHYHGRAPASSRAMMAGS